MIETLMRQRLGKTGTLLSILALLPAVSFAQPAITIEQQVMTTQSCSGRFVRHELEHLTTVPGGGAVRGFDANGSGVALGDLDGDGDLDIVLANHAGPNSILWNETSGGGSAPAFRRQALGEGDARGVVIVDVDGDGLLDIVFSRRVSAPNYWRNTGKGFALTVLPGVAEPLYALGWADLDGDGDLDLAGASYDAALLEAFGAEFLNGGRSGVYVYENRDGVFVPTQLADAAQALTLLLVDLDGDRRLDLVVGNDFAVPDMIWLHREDGWQAAAPFSVTSHSTMSLASGDLDNDGRFELFATDMRPYRSDDATLAAWRPILEMMANEEMPAGDPQRMHNVLQVPGGDGYREEAALRGVAASGWSWSGKFGDLDGDGFLDLYVVNGMAEATIFAQLPGHELTEANLALRNDGRGRFVPVPEWNLGSRRGGRGLSMGDLDNDGDLDVVVNNLRGPAELFENQLCRQDPQRSLQLELRWPGSGNTRALGALVALTTSSGTQWRVMRAGSGYLSGDPPRLHFGIPAGAVLEALRVRWPDGSTSMVTDLEAGTLLVVSREQE